MWSEVFTTDVEFKIFIGIKYNVNDWASLYGVLKLAIK